MPERETSRLAAWPHSEPSYESINGAVYRERCGPGAPRDPRRWDASLPCFDFSLDRSGWVWMARVGPGTVGSGNEQEYE
jgi:hypothetical protein